MDVVDDAQLAKLTIQTINQLRMMFYPARSTSAQSFPSTSRGHHAEQKDRMKVKISLASMYTPTLDSLQIPEDAQKPSRTVIVGWDSFRSRAMWILLAGFVIWIAVFFPLLLGNYL